MRMMKDTAKDGVIGMKTNMNMNPVDMTGKDPKGEARDMRKAKERPKASPKHTKENWPRRKERIRGGISHRKSPRTI